MNLFDCCSDCCSTISCCDCCSDCCSIGSCCCPDCCGLDFSFGGLKFGEGLVLEGDTLKVTVTGGKCTCQPYVLPTASESIKGGIKVGHSLLMNGEGKEVMNVALDTIPSTVEGFMWIHDVGKSQNGNYDDAVDDIWNGDSISSFDSDFDNELDNIFS